MICDSHLRQVGVRLADVPDDRRSEGSGRISGVRGRGGTVVRDMIGGDGGRWIGNRNLNNFLFNFE